MIVYIAGPYRNEDPRTVDQNIQKARDAAAKLWALGYTVVCPHLNTATFERDYPEINDSRYLDGYIEILARCDAIYMLPGWEQSAGSLKELDFALGNGIPAYYDDEGSCLEVSDTETKRPAQCKEYINIVMSGYRTHLAKNADYSPANIAGTGDIGICTRIWDKVSRLMSLVGFDIQIASSTFRAPKTPKNESVEDNIMDLGVYAIIYQIYKRGAWGR